MYEADFLQKPVSIVDGYDFSQLDTIKRIQKYYAGKFEGGNEDAQGYKYFYNISKPRVKNAAKNLDLDTKDINIKADKPEDTYRSWLMRRDIRQWMRTRGFGLLLNEIAMLTPKYGSYVLKKVGGKEIVRRVNLKNLKSDPTAESLEKSGWLIEDHYYTPIELKKETARGWDANEIDKAITSFREKRKENYVDLVNNEDVKMGDAQFILVKEFYGEVPESLLKEGGDKNKFVLAQFIVISSEKKSEAQGEKQKVEGLILSKRKIDEIPYKECHYDREEGRWLGVGIVEDVWDMQVLKNEQINQMILAMRLANLVLFQTGDETITRNIFTDLVNGDVIKAKAALLRIDTQNAGLGTDQIISKEIETLINALANSFEVTTGESLPSGTPFSLGMLINQNANKLFDFIREGIGLFLKEVFEEWVIPELEKNLDEQHILELVDKEELRWINEKLKSQKVWDAVKDFILEEGRKPTQQEVDLAITVLEERLSARDTAYVDIPKGLYDFPKSVDITDEGYNKAVELQTVANILQMVSTNPAILDNPAMKKILDMSGYSEVDFKAAVTNPTQPQMDMTAMMQTAGGKV